MGKKVAVHNLGCKVNAYESDVILSMCKESGHTIVPFAETADIYIINTCCVTAVAEKKSRQMIHRARKMNPDAVIAAVGCYPSVDAKKLLEDGTADVIIGSKGKENILNIIESGLRGYVENADKYVRQSDSGDHCSGIGHTRGFIKIEDGCENYCSYCIIPYARGPVRSRSIDDIINEVGDLVRGGCLEVVLSGISISSYGKDLKNENALAELIEKTAAIPGLERIRLGSMDPAMITEDFLKRAKRSGKLCPHFHLSLQSGCEKTLKAMNRHYTPDEYLRKCMMIRSAFDDPAITTDVIVGFPGENEEDFRESLDFVRKAGFFDMHVFPYSIREGIRAAAMKDQIPYVIKNERVQAMLRQNELSHREWLEKRIGSSLNVLFEEEVVISGRTFISGHTERYEKVIAEENRDIINTICKVRAGETINISSEEVVLAGSLI